jgi:hypothetical protein
VALAILTDIACYGVVAQPRDEGVDLDLAIFLSSLFTKVDICHIVLHLIFSKSPDSISVSCFLFDFSFLDDRLPIVDGFYDLEPILYFNIFLHHFPKQVILHIPNDTLLLNHFQILHDLLLLGEYLPIVDRSPYLFEMLPFVLFQFI